MDKVTSLEQKRAARLEERRRRLINKGVPEGEVDAYIEREDYNNLSPDKKIRRLESMIVDALKSMAQDIESLQHNDAVLAEAMDINFAMVDRALELAGVSKEKIIEIRREIEKEYDDATAKALLKHAEDQVNTAGEPEGPPEGATVFGS